MKITELLTAERILLDITVSTKEEVWNVLAQTFEKTGAVIDRTSYLSDVAKRETLGTTGVGFGVAIPHAKSAAVVKPALGFARVTKSLDVQSLDGTNADLFFLIAAPLNGEDVHLQALSRLARMLMHEDFLAELRSANCAEAVQAALQARE